MTLIATAKHDDGAESDRSCEIEIEAHRAILATACPYFNAMFSSAMKESNEKRIHMKVSWNVCNHYLDSVSETYHILHIKYQLVV